MARSHDLLDDACDFVAAHFPGHGAAMRRLAERDATFLSLCEDYRLARATAERYRQSAGGKDSERARESAELTESLEQEIRASLEGEEPSAARPK
jgi:hypothetical protein